MAGEGATIALDCIARLRTTFTYWPGQRRLCGLGNVPFRRMVPVLASTVLLMKVSVPHSGWFGSLGMIASTRMGLRQISGINLECAGQSVDRTTDGAIAELDLRAFNRRLIGTDSSRQRGGIGMELVVLILRNNTFLKELGIPLILCSRILKLSLVSCQVGSRLV